MATIQDRLEAAKRARDAATAAITPEVEATERLVLEASALEAETREAQARVRAVALAERLASAQEAFPNETLETIDLEGKSPGAGTYVVRKTPTKDRGAWEKGIAKPGADASQLRMVLAAACVVDADIGEGASLRPTSTVTVGAFEADIKQHWLRFSMVPTTITNAALRLAGFAMEEAKS